MQHLKGRKSLQVKENIKVRDFSKSVFAFFIITRILAIICSLPCITDVGLYLDYAVKGVVFDMQAYSSFDFEYPPLALLLIYWPIIILSKIDIYYFQPYYITFACMMFALDFCCLKTCQFYCKERLAMKKEEISYMSLLYSLFGLLLFRILYHRLDMVMALFFSLFLVFFQAKKSSLNWRFYTSIIAGFFYKIIPIFILPSALLLKAFSAKESASKAIAKIFVVAVITLSVFGGVIYSLELYTEHNFVRNMLYHQERGIQIESSYASIILLINMLMNKISLIYNGYGSWNIKESPFMEIIVKNFGHLVMIGFWTALFFVLLYKKLNHEKIKISEENFLEATLLTILLFLAFQPVLSMQFFIWLIPVSAIWLTKNRSIKFLLIFAFIFFASFAIFSLDYFALINEAPILVTILALRNIALIAFTGFLLVRFFNKIYSNNGK
jgi:hypothetical protein